MAQLHWTQSTNTYDYFRNLWRKHFYSTPIYFAFDFNGQSTPDARYVTIFALFPSSEAAGFFTVYLVLSPMEDETAQSRDEHTTFLKFVQIFFQAMFFQC